MERKGSQRSQFGEILSFPNEVSNYPQQNHADKKEVEGFPWWPTGSESATSAGYTGSTPGSGTKTPSAASQLSPRATATEPVYCSY